MKMLVNKIHELILRSMLLAVIIFILVVIIFSDKFIKNELQGFDVLTAQVEEYKNNILLIALLLEDKVNSNIENENINRNNIGGVYKLDNKEFTREEKLILNKTQQLSHFLLGFYKNEDYLLYYRSYIGRKLFTSRFIPGYELSESVFSSERLNINLASTKYGTFQDLKDRIIVSYIYKDDVTGNDVITISSPVYNEKELIGDVSVDIYLEDRYFLEDKNINYDKRGFYSIITIEDDKYPLHLFSYSKEYIVDNSTIFIYKLPFTKVIVDFIWLFIGLILLMFYILYKLSELKGNKIKLNHAESVVNLDELTGLYNRSILNDDVLLKKIVQEKSSIIAIDGDKLKYINDNYGHHIGDEAIKQISHGMRVTFRDSDYLIRTGGDEFLVILPNCDSTAAQRLALDLQENVSSVTFSSYSLSVKVSTGVTSILKKETLESAINRADTLLYSEKSKRK